MKFKVEKGMDVQKTFEQILHFLRENADGYDILKTDCNIYLQLQDEDKNACPINKKEYAVSNGEIVDVYDEYHKKASALGMEKLESYLQYEISKPLIIWKELETAKKRLEKAKERNFKTLDEWEEKIEAYTKALEDSKTFSFFFNDILNAVKDGTAQCRICTFVWKGKWKYAENISLGACVIIKHMGYTYIFGASPDSQYSPCIAVWEGEGEPELEEEDYLIVK